MWSMEAGRFFRFAIRLPAYKSVMRTVVEEAEMKRRQQEERTGGKGVIKLTPAMAKAGPVQGTPTADLAGLIDFG